MRFVWLLTLLTVLAAPAVAGAADAESNWRPVDGLAQDIAITANGTAYVVDAKGAVWRWDNKVFNGWRPFPGRMKRIAAGPDDRLWAIDSEANVRRFDGVRWEKLGFKGRDVAVGSVDGVAVVTEKGDVWLLDRKANSWKSIGGNAENIALAPGGVALAVRADGSIHRYVGGKWRRMPAPPAPASDIDVGPSGEIVVACRDGRLRRWSEQSPHWSTIPGMYSANRVAVGPGGLPWTVAKGGRIFAASLFEAKTTKRVTPSTFLFGNYTFRKVHGVASQVAIGADGSVFAIAARNNDVWRWRTGVLGEWGNFVGKLTRIAVGPDGSPWGIDPKGRVLRFANWTWHETGLEGIDVAIGADGTVMALDSQGVLHRWDGRAAWRGFPADIHGVRVAVDPRGRPWLLSADGGIRRFNGKAWTEVPGKASDIAIGPEGTTMIVNPEEKIRVFRRTQKRWDPVGDDQLAKNIAIGPGGYPWIVDPDGNILATKIFGHKPKEKPVAKAPRQRQNETETPVAAVAGPGPIQFARVRGSAQEVAISARGHVFVVDASGNLQEWDNDARRFRPFGRALQRVAVDRDGNPWGVDAAGNVERFDGSRWRVLPTKANDIAIGADESVFITGRDKGHLYRYSPSDGRFHPWVGTGDRVAVDPNGVPWVIDQGVVRRCASTGCTPMGRRGVDIGIGPRGTVFVGGSRLWQYHPPQIAGDAGTWEAVKGAGNVMAVAVGPRGHPWYVDTRNRIFASAFFSPPKPPTIAGTKPTVATPTIRFIKRYRMTEAYAGNTGDVLATGPESVFTMYRSGSYWSFYKWDSRAKTFKRYDDGSDYSLDGFPRALAVTPDGRLWYMASDRKIYEEKAPKRGFEERSGVPTTGSADFAVIAIGAQGSVFVLGANQKVYKYNESKKRFEDFGLSGTYEWLAVDSAGNPWVSDSSTHRLYRYVDGKLVDPGRSRQKARRFAFGPTGVLFAVGDDWQTVYRWNATNRTFDKVTFGGLSSSYYWEDIAVDADGHPWLENQASYAIFRVK